MTSIHTAILAALALLAGTLATTLAASAHSQSEFTVPADGSTVEAARTLEITFDAPMRITVFRLTSDGEEVAVKRETGMEPVTLFRAAPAVPLAPGRYQVEWRGLSGDGHPMNGAFGFTIAK